MGRIAYPEQLEAEAKTWLIEDEWWRREKVTRECMRHPKLIRDLLLDRLPTHQWNVLEVGGGPVPLSDQLPHQARVVVDPLTIEYRRFFPVPDHVPLQAEAMMYRGNFDLVICTNALDHVESVDESVGNMNDALRAGGFLAIMCAENNALTNPHPCHTINLMARDIHSMLDEEYETVWELNYSEHGYRYGWVEHEGKRGQPAFALLMRKCTGYRREAQ